MIINGDAAITVDIQLKSATVNDYVSLLSHMNMIVCNAIKSQVRVSNTIESQIRVCIATESQVRVCNAT